MQIVNLVEDTEGVPCCHYEHGLSFYVETGKHKLLSDCGATEMFLRNAKALGVDVSQVDTVILSHGHYDHAGGILSFAARNPQAKIYLKQSAGDDYYHVSPQDVRYIGIEKEIMKLPNVVTVTDVYEIDEELFLFSGITGRKFPSKGNLELKKKIGKDYVQDSFEHEQCLVITQEGRHILMSGCAHNGILNILDRYYEIFGAWPQVVISGFHMMKKGAYTGEEKEIIRQTARELQKIDALFYTGHCTGQTAFEILKEIMGEQLRGIHSGERLL